MSIINSRIPPFAAALVIAICPCGNPLLSQTHEPLPLPHVRIDTHGRTIPDDPKINARMEIFAVPDSSISGGIERVYDGPIGIELRGTSSLGWPKKQYGVKTRGADGKSISVSLLGLPEEEDWILSAPYTDRSALRDALACTLARDMGWYASRFRYCELTLNGLYQGVYLLMEKIKRDGKRVDIAKLSAQDNDGDAVTGGYILKFDYIDADEVGFYGAADSPGSFLYIHVYPEATDITPSQRGYIQDFIRSFEAVMHSPQASDALNGYATYIDVASFVDYLLLTELTNNIDGYIRSCYMHKDRDSSGGKLTMGPVWDFNYSMGAAHERGGRFSDGWRIHRNQVPFWWHVLLRDTAFVARLGARWAELRSTLFDEHRLFSWIDSVTQVIRPALTRDHALWRSFDTYIWLDAWRSRGIDEEADFLKSWLHDRLRWIDAHLPGITQWRPAPEVDALHRLLSVYPQPCGDILHSEFTLGMYGNVSLSVVDLFGRKRVSASAGILGIGGHSASLNLNGLATGVYVLRLHVGSEIVDARTITITR
ncbi:MAG: CotH kinase family protein [Bacteroidia bacterium]|nr:CotH kinase family protein [Bacteroidia bacterium]